jgi:lipoprotein-anchoring transpeptidase ErfK/SrfK
LRRLLVVEPQTGDRLKVWNPENELFGFVEAGDVGPSGPSIWIEARVPQVVRQIGMQGRSVGDTAYLRNLPDRDDETEIRHLPNNSAIKVVEAVTSPTDGKEWYRIEGGGYIRADEVRLPSPVAAVRPGRWIDVDLNEPAIVTAYEGNRVVYSALAIKGFSATPTLRGTFQILYRVEKETMDSETIGIPRDGPGGYLLKDVLFTQYFTNDGASLHYNYWLGTFGLPGSHGCLGLNLEDASWFWDWATVGTPVVIR